MKTWTVSESLWVNQNRLRCCDDGNGELKRDLIKFYNNFYDLCVSFEEFWNKLNRLALFNDSAENCSNQFQLYKKKSFETVKT